MYNNGPKCRRQNDAEEIYEQITAKIFSKLIEDINA